MPEFTRTPAALVVLNLLCERPRHPYALRILIRERGISSVVKIGSASIYDAVNRLERAGLIEASETCRAGRRPERTVYTATDSGRDELELWMADLLAEPVDEYAQFRAALAFVIGVGRDSTVALLRMRVARLEADIAARAALTDSLADLPRIVLIEGEYTQALRVAELNWLRAVIRDIDAGSLWSDAELEALFAMTSAADREEHAAPAEITRAQEKRIAATAKKRET
jgi:DNA-binding PadR family transcriptional regulator